MQHNDDPISTSEAAFIVSAAGEAGVRVDGRRCLEPRELAVAFGLEGELGSVQVRLGETKVLAVAAVELVEPYPDRPTEGILQFFTELSPMASPAFEPGRPSEAAIELMRLLDRALRKSQAIDVEALCVVAGKHVWSIRCDVTVLDHRGNLTDASLLAAVAALKHLRLPAIEVSGTGEQASVRILPADQGERQPLVFHHTPVAVSLGFLPAVDASSAGGASGAGVGASGGGGGAAPEPTLVVDPNDREERVLSAALTVVVNQHQELCALHKPGGAPIAAARIVECVKRAAALAPQRLLTLEVVLQQHAARLAAAAETLRRTGRVAQPATQRDGPLLQPEPPPPPPLPPPSDDTRASGGRSGGADAKPSGAAGDAAGQPPKAKPSKRKRETAGGAASVAVDSDDDEGATVTVRSAFG